MKHRIKELRNELGLSQEQLGARVGFKKSYISQIEAGKKRLNQDSIPLFAKALNVTEFELFDLDDLTGLILEKIYSVESLSKEGQHNILNHIDFVVSQEVSNKDR